MEREKAKEMAAEILNSRLQMEEAKLSGEVGRSKMVYGCIRRIAAKRVRNLFVRRILKFVDGLSHLVVRKLDERIATLKEGQRKIQEVLKDLSSGQLNSTIELLEKISQPLVIRVDSVDAIGENLYFYDIWRNTRFIDLVSTLKGEDEEA